MNGIYYCEGIDFSDKNNTGIINKVKNQIKCLGQLGELQIIRGKNNFGIVDYLIFLMPIVKSKKEKQREKILKAASDNTRYIYIRKPSLTKNFYKVLKKVKAKYPRITVIIEIPTYPFHTEYRGLKKVLVLKSKACEKKLNKVVDYVATYSNDKEIWGVKTINLSNCVDYSLIKPRSSRYKTINKTIRLTCVANFTYWHGLDRLINGIKEYNGDYKIILNVVGGGKEIKNLKNLSNKDERIIFHGPKNGEELDEIFENTDIAIDALGRHRSGVYYNSSLKGKEYVARGLPIISAVKTELDNIRSYKYYYRFAPDESNIDIKTVILFYNGVYKNAKEISVINNIRNTTEKMFDYKYGFKDKIMKILNENKYNV